MDHDSVHSILYGNIQIPTSHISPYVVDESVLLYEPLPEDIIKDGNRTIFNNVAITPEEENILEDFLRYISDDYLVKNQPNLEEKVEWLYIMEPEFLRFLYSTGFDYKKTLDCLFMNYQFRKSNMLPAMLDDIEDELNDGYMYWFGRDKKFRPTLVADVFKLQNLSVDKLVKLVVFCFEFFLRYLHVGGKSENYNVLIDCDNRGVVQLPAQMIIHLTEIMHSKYRSRLNNLFLVNTPNLINVILKPLKGLLPEKLVKKIVIVKHDSKEKLLLQYDPNQLQQRFGGNTPNLTSHYYPFHFFTNSKFNSFTNSDVSTDEYSNLDNLDEISESESLDMEKDNKDNKEKDEQNINNNNENTTNKEMEDKNEQDKDIYEIGKEDYLVKNYSILTIPPSVLYGRCMIVDKFLSDYLCKLVNTKVNEVENQEKGSSRSNKDNSKNGDSGNKDNNEGYNQYKDNTTTKEMVKLEQKDLYLNNYCNQSNIKYRNEWFNNIRYYMLSKDAGKYLVNKIPEMKNEIEFSTIRGREDLIRFINNLN